MFAFGGLPIDVASLEPDLNDFGQRLAEAESRGLVVQRKANLNLFACYSRVIYSYSQDALDLSKPLDAIRAWLIHDAAGASNRPVITALAFRYRGSQFVPAAPDAADDAARRGRDVSVFTEQTETLAEGESVVRVQWESEEDFTPLITFTTDRGRALKFGSNPRIPERNEEASAGGAPLVGFGGYREVIGPYTDRHTFEQIDILGGATFTLGTFYFSTAWIRRRHVVLIKALWKKSRATHDGDALWARILDLQEGHWRLVVRCL